MNLDATYYLANLAKMGRPRDAKKVRVFVEGDPDASVYGRFLDPDRTIMVPAPSTQGKGEVIRAVDILLRQQYKNAIGIVDQDFDWKLSPGQLPHVFCTDTHDLETMALRSPALGSTLSQCIKASELNEREIRLRLLAEGVKIGYLMMHSQQGRLRLNFKNLSFPSFYDAKEITIDGRALVRDVVLNSPSVRIDEEELSSAVANLSWCTDDPWLLCRGHDLVNMLAEHIRFLGQRS